MLIVSVRSNVQRALLTAPIMIVAEAILANADVATVIVSPLPFSPPPALELRGAYIQHIYNVMQHSNIHTTHMYIYTAYIQHINILKYIYLLDD